LGHTGSGVAPSRFLTIGDLACRIACSPRRETSLYYEWTNTKHCSTDARVPMHSKRAPLGCSSLHTEAAFVHSRAVPTELSADWSLHEVPQLVVRSDSEDPNRLLLNPFPCHDRRPTRESERPHPTFPPQRERGSTLIVAPAVRKRLAAAGTGGRFP